MNDSSAEKPNQTKKINNAFSSRYPEVVFGWSYKTNYLSAICNTFHQEGAWAKYFVQRPSQK